MNHQRKMTAAQVRIMIVLVAMSTFSMGSHETGSRFCHAGRPEPVKSWEPQGLPPLGATLVGAVVVAVVLV